MQTRITILCVALGLVYVPSSGAEDGIPRTESGKPDLSGTYDIASLTQFERPQEYGESLTMSVEEARRIEAVKADSTAQADTASDPDRGAPPAGGDLHLSRVGGHNQWYFDRGTTVFALDGLFRTSILTDPPNGRLPELTEAGKVNHSWSLGCGRGSCRPRDYQGPTGDAWWVEAEDNLYDNPEGQTLGTRCIYSGGPTVPIRPASYNNLKTITQTETHVVILVEWMHWARVVRLDSIHLPSEMRSLGGDSIGWWEGDTLVVDTTNFLASPTVPREGFHVVERFRRVDGDTVLYEFTVDDPDYTAPFSGSLPWPRTDKRLFEYACHEGNYSMGNTLRGARLLEREWSDEHGG